MGNGFDSAISSWLASCQKMLLLLVDIDIMLLRSMDFLVNLLYAICVNNCFRLQIMTRDLIVLCTMGGDALLLG
jgi:hypothetical protein